MVGFPSYLGAIYLEFVSTPPRCCGAIDGNSRRHGIAHPSTLMVWGEFIRLMRALSFFRLLAPLSQGVGSLIMPSNPEPIRPATRMNPTISTRKSPW